MIWICGITIILSEREVSSIYSELNGVWEPYVSANEDHTQKKREERRRGEGKKEKR